MAFTAADVKTLREATGAGMLDCKKALQDADGNLAEAEKILKEKGLAAMAKRSDRATGEGRIVIKQDGNKIAMVEVTCETDFVANNEDFHRKKMGVEVIHRTDSNYSQTVMNVAQSIIDVFALKPTEWSKLSRSAQKTSKLALWSNFIKHYDVAYAHALEEAKKR